MTASPARVAKSSTWPTWYRCGCRRQTARRRASTCDSWPSQGENAATLILPLIQPPAHDHHPAAHQGTVRPGPGHGLRGLPALPADDEPRTVVTARALAITTSDSDTHAPWYRAAGVLGTGADR